MWIRRKRKRGCEASRRRLRFNPPFRTKTICLAVIKHCETSQNDCPLEHTSPHLHCTLILSFFVFTLPLSHPPIFVRFTFQGFPLAHTYTKKPCDHKRHLHTHVHTLPHTQHARTQQIRRMLTQEYG